LEKLMKVSFIALVPPFVEIQRSGWKEWGEG